MNESKVDISQITENLSRLRDDISQSAARRMVSAAGILIRNQARKEVRARGLVKTGVFVENLVTKREKTPEGVEQFNVGVRNSNQLTRKQKQNYRLRVNKSGKIVKKFADDAFYWRFLEFGTKFIKNDLHPIQNAFDANIEAAIERMAEVGLQQVEKALK